MKTGLLIIFQVAKENFCILEDLSLSSYFLQSIIGTSWQSHHRNNCQIGSFKFIHCMKSLPMKIFCSQNNLIVKWFMGWDYNKCFSEIKIYWCCANLKFIVMLKINVGINFDGWTVEVGKDAEFASLDWDWPWLLSIWVLLNPVNNDPHKTRIISSHRPIRNNYYWIKHSFCLLNILNQMILNRYFSFQKLNA